MRNGALPSAEDMCAPNPRKASVKGPTGRLLSWSEQSASTLRPGTEAAAARKKRNDAPPLPRKALARPPEAGERAAQQGHVFSEPARVFAVGQVDQTSRFRRQCIGRQSPRRHALRSRKRCRNINRHLQIIALLVHFNRGGRETMVPRPQVDCVQEFVSAVVLLHDGDEVEHLVGVADFVVIP